MTDLVISNLQSLIPGLAGYRLKAFDARLQGMEVTGIDGPSGSGKSLLLRAIADLDPSMGEVRLGNQLRAEMKAHEWRKRVCYLPTESAWWFETVGEHFPIDNESYLEKLGFEISVLGWKISRMSSGEKQRLALARCLCRSPEALLLDEPTASLDQSNTLSVEDVITAYSLRMNAPVLWVSHDRKQLERIAQRILTIQTDGSIKEEKR